MARLPTRPMNGTAASAPPGASKSFATTPARSVVATARPRGCARPHWAESRPRSGQGRATTVRAPPRRSYAPPPPSSHISRRAAHKAEDEKVEITPDHSGRHRRKRKADADRRPVLPGPRGCHERDGEEKGRQHQHSRSQDDGQDAHELVARK